MFIDQNFILIDSPGNVIFLWLSIILIFLYIFIQYDVLKNIILANEPHSAKSKNDTQLLEALIKRTSLLEKHFGMLQGMLTKTDLLNSNTEELREAIKAISETIAQIIRLLEETIKKRLGDIQKTTNEKREHAQRDVERLSKILKELSSEYEKPVNDLKTLYEERETFSH
uniref:Uncharacterized protein n=1 Tax=Panagrolaimus davidi TaxID=227884 RepID=A0A914QNG6_9BILA